jgi:hypothetical protein
VFYKKILPRAIIFAVRLTRMGGYHSTRKEIMIEEYFANGRKQWKIFCSTCTAYLGSTAALEKHVDQKNMIENKCPVCGGRIHESPPPRKPGNKPE